MWRDKVDADKANDLAEKIMEIVKRHRPANVLCALEIAFATATICSSKTHGEALTILSDSTEMIMELIDTYPKVHECHWEKEH